MAALQSHAHLVEMLLDARADPTLAVRAGQFVGKHPLDMARLVGADACAALLLRHSWLLFLPFPLRLRIAAYLPPLALMQLEASSTIWRHLVLSGRQLGILGHMPPPPPVRLPSPMHALPGAPRPPSRLSHSNGHGGGPTPGTAAAEAAPPPPPPSTAAPAATAAATSASASALLSAAAAAAAAAEADLEDEDEANPIESLLRASGSEKPPVDPSTPSPPPRWSPVRSFVPLAVAAGLIAAEPPRFGHFATPSEPPSPAAAVAKPAAKPVAKPPKAAATARVPTLVLDLDETLVHASVSPTPKDDFAFSFLFGGATHTMYVRRRPFLDKFLDWLRAGPWEVVIFTASVKAYADKLLDSLDPTNDLFTHRMYREHCTPLDGCFTKDLRLLGREMSQILLVENSPLSYCFQPGNAILVPTWVSDDTDTELLTLMPLLDELAAAEDVRPTLQRRCAMRDIIRVWHANASGGDFDAFEADDDEDGLARPPSQPYSLPSMPPRPPDDTSATAGSACDDDDDDDADLADAQEGVEAPPPYQKPPPVGSPLRHSSSGGASPQNSAPASKRGTPQPSPPQRPDTSSFQTSAAYGMPSPTVSPRGQRPSPTGKPAQTSV